MRTGALPRRDIVRGLGIGAAALIIAPRLAFADAKAVQTEIDKLYAGKAMAEGRVKLDLPQIAENGLVVPIGVEVESPMTDADFVRSVHVYSDGNPLPAVISFHFTAMSGKAAANARIRLAQTQNVIAVAEMSDGKLFTARQEVKVTIGGCGG